MKGSFDLGDKPLRVTNAKISKETSVGSPIQSDINNLIVTIEWQSRSNGTKPTNTNVPNHVAKKHCPALLVDFYESKINFKGSISSNKPQPKK